MVKKVYVYVVLFATLMMTIGGSVSAIMNLADMLHPAPYYQSFEQYKEMSGVKQPPAPDSSGKQSPQQLSDSQLKQNYDQLVASERDRSRQTAINHFIKSLAWILIPFPLFVFYQRKVLRSGE